LEVGFEVGAWLLCEDAREREEEIRKLGEFSSHIDFAMIENGARQIMSTLHHPVARMRSDRRLSGCQCAPVEVEYDPAAHGVQMEAPGYRAAAAESSRSEGILTPLGI
jgi:GMP synthase-like glutamine amidotransferase